MTAAPRPRPRPTPSQETVRCDDYRAHQAHHRQTPSGWICDVCEAQEASQVGQRSSVSLWRTSQAQRWSVRLVEGTTSAEINRLVDLALAAADRLEARDSGDPA